MRLRLSLLSSNTLPCQWATVYLPFRPTVLQHTAQLLRQGSVQAVNWPLLRAQPEQGLLPVFRETWDPSLSRICSQSPAPLGSVYYVPLTAAEPLVLSHLHATPRRRSVSVLQNGIRRAAPSLNRARMPSEPRWRAGTGKNVKWQAAHRNASDRT